MADTFSAESGRSQIMEDIPAVIVCDGKETTGTCPSLLLSDKGKEIKQQILNHLAHSLRNNAGACVLVYVDDNREEVLDDETNLKAYEGDLACDNSKLKIVYPRTAATTNPPSYDFEDFSVKVRKVPGP